jgi:hypothetical protein
MKNRSEINSTATSNSACDPIIDAFIIISCLLAAAEAEAWRLTRVASFHPAQHA